jgi:hypothetical protein
VAFRVAEFQVMFVAGCVVAVGGWTVGTGVAVGTGAGAGCGFPPGGGTAPGSVSASEALETVDRLAELVAVMLIVSLVRADPSF